MPKKKKTRKQKELTDVRRHNEPRVTKTATFEPSPQTRHVPIATTSPQPEPKTISTVTPRHISTADYKYLAGDLRKTLFLTFAIVAIELVLKFGTGI